MNILVLIRELDKTPLEREVRNGGIHGEIITFYNQSNNDYCLIVDSVEYNNIVQVCLILKEGSYYIYIHYGENPSLIKIDIDSIKEIGCFHLV